MGWFDKLDKLANAGAGNRMSGETRARADGQSDTTRRRNNLAHKANGFTTTRAEKQAAERALIGEVGEKEARKLIRQTADKACGK
ncbi:hypothetical protein ABZ912_20145 [Nonomuraea angiospora]|uniref:hypothetical protein n=1 Tax=Nonomuraea angiospora TaxID=46172 RepID=UPI0033E0695A